MFWRPVAVVGRTRRRSSQDSSVSQEGKRLGLRVAAPFPELFLGRDTRLLQSIAKTWGVNGPHPQPGFASLAPEKVNATITPDLLFEVWPTSTTNLFPRVRPV